MKNKNIGKTDRVLRVIVGLGLIAYGIINQNPIGFVGLIPLLTAAIGFCPLYRVMGCKTTECCGGGCHASEKKE